MEGTSESPPARPVRRVRAAVTAGLAVLVTLLVLVAPTDVGAFGPWAFLRIPVEGLLGVALLLVLRGRAGRVVAVLAGTALGVLAVVKLVDLGFQLVLARPFNPVYDGTFFVAAAEFVAESAGRAAMIGAVAVVALLAVAAPILMTLSVLRLSRLVTRHTAAATGTVGALGVVWVVCAVVGAQLVPGVPIAGRAYERLLQVPASLADRETFAARAAVDAFGDTPGERLLTALRGKDVLVVFVESYGRDAVADPEFAPGIGAVLEAGRRRLAAAGFSARSGFLTSPTAGGGSWLAHATLLSGLWVDNQQRYSDLVASDRLTLGGAFHRAGWRTVGVMPGVVRDWPERAFYRYDRLYTARDLGYRGPGFTWGTIPDQYTLSAFQRLERAREDRPPLMAKIALVSSHAPWAPLPRLIGWDEVGDGSAFAAVREAGEEPGKVWRDFGRVRTEYRRSIEYTLSALLSYVATYGDDDLVVVLVGDHQPAPLITGAGASRDVPASIIARDPSVLSRLSGWGWHDGLRPGPDAPVWPMDTFRDRFLAAFSPADDQSVITQSR